MSTKQQCSSVKTSNNHDRVIILGNEVGESNTDELIRCSNSPEEVDPAPAPGSLADREHRKWEEKAVILAHNPYNTENIGKRRLSRSSSFMETNHLLPETRSLTTERGRGYSDHGRKINCGLRSVNASLYNRDYFINKNGSDYKLVDVSFTPEEMMDYINDPNEILQSNEFTEESLGEHSEENNNDSMGDSKLWDSGVGSSGERTSTSTISVSEGIKKFEEEIHRSEKNLNTHMKWLSHKSCTVDSMDSLLGWTTDEPPALPARSRFGSEANLLPPPLPARRTMMNPKKVTYAEHGATVQGISSNQESYDVIRSKQKVYDDFVNEYDDEQQFDIIPTLPSVRDLATKFQVKKSPEPKPRKSLIKKKTFESRTSRVNKNLGTSFQTSYDTTNTHALFNHPEDPNSLHFPTNSAKCKETLSLSQVTSEHSQHHTARRDNPQPHVSAKVSADDDNVLYQVPPPPLINEDTNFYYPEIDEEEFDKFIDKVKNSSPVFSGSLKISETSSVTLPGTWSSSSLDKRSDTQESPLSKCSQDSILTESPHVQGPVILLGENFEPQVMTDDYEAPRQVYSSSSMGSSMFYSTYIPDSRVMAEEVSIVCNEFTQIETDSADAEDHAEPEYNTQYGKAWTSNIRLPSLMDYWENKNIADDTNKFKKYASESNIFENSHPPENGLRKITKDKHFTSCEESFPESDYSVQSGYEDHIYQKIEEASAPTGFRAKEESGFFSYESNAPAASFRFTANIREISEEPSDFDDDLPDPTYAQCFGLSDKEFAESEDDSDNHVTVIAVDYIDTNQTNNNNNNTEDWHHPVQKHSRFSSVKDLMKLFEKETSFEQKKFKSNNQLDSSDTVHSLTARSVPRSFRDGLMSNKASPRDNIAKVPHGNTMELYPGLDDSQVHVVYDSRSDYRSDSPEHSGIPAMPVVFTRRRQVDRERGEQGGYTSDDSSLGTSSHKYSAYKRKQQSKKEKIIWA